MKRMLTFVMVALLAAGVALFLMRRLLVPQEPPAVAPVLAASLWQASLPRVDLRIFLTGQTQSYLDVCGCATRQEGGLAPRATLLSQLRAEVPAGICLDAGGLLGQSESLDVARAEVTLAALGDMDYDAVLLSGAELRRGYDLIAGLAQDSTVEFISCNVAAAGTGEAFWSPFRVLDRGGRRIAVIGLTRLFGWNDAGGFRLIDYRPAMSTTLAALESFKPDFTILLCDLAPGLDDAFLATLTSIDLIATHGVGEATGQVAGKPVLYSVPKGKRLTWVDVQFTDRGERFGGGDRAVEQTLPRDPVVQRRLEAFYQRIMREYGPSSPKPLAHFKAEQDPDNFYVGSDVCKACHQPEYAQWETTTHAVAFNLLYGRNRHYAPDVFAYYVTGWGSPTGFHRVDPNDRMAHVSCETCHGPGGRHAGSEKKQDIRGKVGKEICLACHVPAWDPHFQREYDEKLKEVLHRPGARTPTVE